MGVKEPSDLSFIEKSIIAQGKTYVTKENAIVIGRYLFNTHKKGLLQEWHYEQLYNLNVITTKNSLVSSNESFLSDFYEPELKLEQTYFQDFFISSEYIEEKDLKSEWKTFFIKIGVNETISWTKKNLSRIELQSKYPEYFSIIPSGVPNQMWGFPNDFYSYEFNLVSFIELCKDYYFSKNFWAIVLIKNLPIKQGHIDLGIGYYNLRIQSLNNWIIKNEPIIPNTQKNCLKASQTYSSVIPQIKEIGGKYLPIFDFEGAIPPDWQEYLGLKETLGLHEYLEVLKGIWMDNTVSEMQQRENQKRVVLIYEKLSLLNLHQSEMDEIREWSKSNKLLAKNGTDFYYPNELAIVTVEGFRASNLAYVEKTIPEIIKLLRNFGIKIIDKVIPTISNSKVEITDLKTKLQQISPLIALVAVEKSKNRKEWEDEYERIRKKLSAIRFFETTEIYLSYGNDDDRQKRSSCAENDNFYYVGKWYSPRVLDGLVEPLGSFLKIRYAERILTVLLLESFSEGIEYLIEKGFDISLIPEELINSNESEIRMINQGNRAYNQSDEDLGKQGELVVFENLKQKYSQKYSQSVEETLTGFRVGAKVEVFWRNKNNTTTANHDFKVVELGKEIYIDSKATPYGKNIEKVCLYISGGELDLMETAEKYLIARVYNATSSTNVEVEFVRLQIDSP
ncbi:MAG: DUF3883 domain-containing protein [Chitinophagales bacterium]|nr:DUF3883 domain-containing protein [Chitinophagales bacterium]